MLAQGDILLVPVSVVPPNAVRCPGPVIVGYGEASGHQHVMVGDCEWLVEALDDIQLFAKGVDIGRPVFIRAGNGVRLAHLTDGGRPTTDHDTIDVPPGRYQVIRQRQWVTGAIRPVAD